ncbi:tetraspanin-33-like isoform X1 [Dysidea avara]|uniref:tetraspanin-33-like isoform X1 n=1 Tax=Dysidea avara TaxID=196820 RepID=UPI003321CFBD
MAGCCNLLAKFFLFVVNILIWILGGALLAIGIIAELQKEDYGDVSSSVLASPAIICIIIGSVLFLLGLLGAVGALVELYYVLMIYVLLLFIILLVEIGVAVFIYVQNDETEDIIREQMEELIKEYRNDPDLQDLIDSIQSDLLECCGIDRPDDWQLNPYFNCSSPSLQACSVPFSCCLPEENSTVVNTQCGDGALRIGNTGSRSQLIYTNGCYGEFEELIENVLPILGGILLGIFVLEVLSIFLTVGLVVDIRNEKSRARKWHKAHPKQRKKKKTELENFTLVSPSHK